MDALNAIVPSASRNRVMGMQHVIEQKDYPSGEFTTAWGVSDEAIFDKALAEMDSLHATGRPFYTLVLSVSNHRPYTYPAGRIAVDPNDHKRVNAVQYADWALGRFVRQARTHAFFDSTVFVLMELCVQGEEREATERNGDRRYDPSADGAALDPGSSGAQETRCGRRPRVNRGLTANSRLRVRRIRPNAGAGGARTRTPGAPGRKYGRHRLWRRSGRRSGRLLRRRLRRRRGLLRERARVRIDGGVLRV